jgi:hypothetical protein
MLEEMCAALHCAPARDRGRGLRVTWASEACAIGVCVGVGVVLEVAAGMNGREHDDKSVRMSRCEWRGCTSGGRLGVCGVTAGVGAEGGAKA